VKPDQGASSDYQNIFDKAKFSCKLFTIPNNPQAPLGIVFKGAKRGINADSIGPVYPPRHNAGGIGLLGLCSKAKAGLGADPQDQGGSGPAFSAG
jgi:hypothetical protein